MPRVHLVKGKDPYKNTTKLLGLAGRELLYNLKSPLIIKPNLVDENASSGANTNPMVVKAVTDYITSKGRIDIIIIADGSSGDTQKAFEKSGYNSIFEDSDIELRDLNKDKPVWIDIINPLTSRPQKLPIAESIINARYLISAAMPKTHDHGIVTLGLKNLVGAIPGRKWKQSIHGNHFPEDMTDDELEYSIKGFHNNILAINKKVRIDFSIIDGTLGMEGDGPMSGKPKKGGFGIAGFDPVAVDAITTYLMGLDPYEIGYIYLCEKAKLGVADISKISVEQKNWTKLRRRFKPHKRYSYMHFKP